LAEYTLVPVSVLFCVYSWLLGIG